MRFASGISGKSDWAAALDDLTRQVGRPIGREAIHLVTVFISAHFDDDLEQICAALTARFPEAALLGCTAEGTIGAGIELERRPSMSLLAASLPGVALRPFHLSQTDLEATDTPEEWTERLAVRPDESAIFIVLGDPFSFHIHRFLDQMNEHYPASPVFGGMASAAERPRQNGLVLNGLLHREGLVGMALSGNVNVRSVVSQGCRPIGKPFIVTKGDRNIIRELGGKPALVAVKEVTSALAPDDLRLASEALFVGRVINEYQETFKRGDFLIHNLMGADPGSGALAIAGPVKVGITVQLHVRDARSADEDLRELLKAAGANGGTPPAGALIFSCNGRGTRMWAEPGHDAAAFGDVYEDVPAAGFFCAGELGPVGQRNFIHGFTASIALFSPAKPG